MINGKLRILYIYFGGDLSEKLPGVQNKIFEKVRALNSESSTCIGITFDENILKVNAKDNIEFHPIIFNKQRKYLRNFLKLRLIFENLEKVIENKKNDFDLILFRYPLASVQLLKFTKKYQKKVVFEHNTIEEGELKLQLLNLLKHTKFSLKPGYFINIIQNGFLPLILEKFFAKSILKNCLTGISVTEEIAEYQKKRYNAINFVSSNSIDTTKFSIRNKVENLNHGLNLIMLIGFGNEWHGVDRLINSASKYNGGLRINIYLIGNIRDQDLNLINFENPNVQINVINKKTKIELNSILQIMHIGIGSLGLFKIGLTEASPLKVREYLANGFPIIIGYRDTDLHNQTVIKDSIFQVNNDNSPLDFEKIATWYKGLSIVSDFQIDIQKFANLNLDTTVKMNKLRDFLIQKIP